LPGAKQRRCAVDHPTPSSAEVNERVELYPYSPFWAFMVCYRANFTLTFDFYSDGRYSRKIAPGQGGGKMREVCLKCRKDVFISLAT
jgi:hypothetical protein